MTAVLVDEIYEEFLSCNQNGVTNMGINNKAFLEYAETSNNKLLSDYYSSSLSYEICVGIHDTIHNNPQIDFSRFLDYNFYIDYDFDNITTCKFSLPTELSHCKDLWDGYLLYRSLIGDVKKHFTTLRYPNMPEGVVETVLMHKLNGLNVTPGDTWFAGMGITECKCSSSTGPTSFSPTSNPKTLLYIKIYPDQDINQWFVYKMPYIQLFDEPMNQKGETFRDHCNAGRRPRISMEDIIKRKGIYVDTINVGDIL